jgi:hypothetical protein
VLNYCNQWLARSCGTYPEALWEEVWDRNGRVYCWHEREWGGSAKMTRGSNDGDCEMS